ncbi:MAG TPA: TIGR02265 family protein [Thermoanaerobaculia bacterium]|nr:TIGR02265 family protein [Thermoanaerobaculia bacterium]HUM28634.1 TIGR02265 family protein [Thermoanaerobaculia bacterium]HXK66758.1 TIGR02265 family protein [Thermoanaerobaculia bacterium]
MKIKGNIIKSRIAFIKTHSGDEGWKKVLQALPEDDRHQLEGLLTGLSWYSFDLGKRLDDAIIAVLGKGDRSFFERIGRASARENLMGVHKSFLSNGDPQAFMEKSPMIYKFYYDVGYRTYERTGPTSGTLTTFEAETFSAADCLTVIGWYKEGLELCGATDVRASESSCRAEGADFCQYHFSWTME